MTETTSTRTSRSRRVVALMGWGCLVATAFLLWNARQAGSVRSVTIEPVAFLLAAFAAFVGVFAWMLYNPGRRSAAESPSLFFGAGATLFPPPIIGFCLMPIDSELRWWLALGLFLLCAIAILSHLPDEFFGVPRSRQTYLTPLPAFDSVAGTVLDPESSWFRFEDLSRVVADSERPSLAPRAYLQREVSRSSSAVRTELRAATAVDDILGSDFDLGLLDDALPEDDLLDRRRSADVLTARPVQREFHQNSPVRDRQQNAVTPVSTTRAAASPRPATDALPRPAATVVGGPSLPLNYPLTGQTPYQAFNPESRYLVAHQKQRRHAARQSSARRAVSRQSGPARSLEVTEPDSAAGRSTGVSQSVSQPSRPQSSTASAAPVGSSALAARAAGSGVRPGSGVRDVSSARKAHEESRVPASTESRSHTSRASVAASSVSRTAHAAHSVAAPAALAGSALAPSPAAQMVSVAEPASQNTRQLFGQTLPQQRELPDRPSDRDAVRADFDAPTSGREPSGRRSRFDTSPTAATAMDSSGSSQEPDRSVSTATGVQERAQVQELNPTFQRTKEANGTELVEGVMPVHFDRGQKRVNVHVPFSPPLAGVPDVECESVDGEDLRLKVAVRQSYGIRIEARRSIAGQPLDTEIGFAAIYVSGADSV